jgi:hypothetical protein
MADMGIKNLSRSVFTVVGLLLPALAFGQGTVQRTIEGRAVNLVIPTGFCVLDVDSVMGKEWYAFQETLIEGRGAVILTYASCAEVEKRKADPAFQIQSHGAYVTIYPFGSSAVVPPGFSRQQTVSFISSTIPRLAEKVGDDLNARLRQVDLDKQLQVNGLTIGYLDEDQNAVYAGMVSWFHRGASRTRTIGVGGFTQVAGLVLSTNLYEDEAPDVTFGGLLERQRKVMQELVARNP